jgi:delta 1-pyrroline-5-carboxylate dehydrogenase
MSDIPILEMPGKLVGEELIYSADFTGDLGTATIISRAVPSISGGTLLGAVGGAGGLVSAMIGGGTADGQVVALYEAVTSDGQRLQCYLAIPVYGAPT